MPTAVTLLPTARSTRVPYLSQERSRWTQIIILQRGGIRVVVFTATFNNISAISWRSVLLEETEVPRENHWPAASQWMFHRVHLAMNGTRTHSFVVIGTDCIGTCKSNCQMITITTTPWLCKEMTFLGNMLLILNTFSFYFTKRGMYGILMSKILLDF